MKRIEMEIGLLSYVIEHVTKEMRSLYLHRSNGCEYLGTWDLEDFEQEVSILFQKFANRMNVHY